MHRDTAPLMNEEKAAESLVFSVPPPPPALFPPNPDGSLQ